MASETHQTIESRLRRGRHRYTGGRRKLVAALLDAARPLTIPEILERTDDLSQSSVYRNLQVLERTGSIRRIVMGDDSGARFELAEDLTEHHHHLICRTCGSVRDFEPSERLERSLEGLAEEASEKADFTVDQHRFDLVGTCSDCSG